MPSKRHRGQSARGRQNELSHLRSSYFERNHLHGAASKGIELGSGGQWKASTRMATGMTS